jgi:hypothetical protein
MGYGHLFLSELQNLLLDTVRARVRNGLLTERGLAKLLGISQPHLHNVLKGTRHLSLEMSDRMLAHLRLSAVDLIDVSVLRRYVAPEASEPGAISYLPLLSGSIGPTQPWPGDAHTHERFPVAANTIARMWHPVVVRLGADAQMYPLFSEGDLMLLDQSQAARTHIDPDALYLIKRGDCGLVRRVRRTSDGLFMVTEDAIGRPAEWERLQNGEHPVSYFVRARGALITREVEWMQ